MNLREIKVSETSPPLAPLTLGGEDFLSVEFPEILPEQAQAPGVAASASEVDSGKKNVLQARLKNIDGRLTLLLPPDKEIKDEDGSTHISVTWADLLEQLQQGLAASERFWQPGTLVYLQSGDRLLDASQLQEISEALQSHQLTLHGVATDRRQTAINAATAGLSVEQGRPSHHLASNRPALDDPLYVTMTVRSGTEIRHPGSVIVFGDINAGGEAIADGDILVWGKLKGKAHAGASGNAQAVIMALHLEATQLRIADFIARVESPDTNFCPEVAYVSTTGSPGICIVRADYFSVRNPRS